MSQLPRSACFLGVIILLIFSFSYAQKIETVDGVRIVHNGRDGKWGKNPQISVEFVKTIGDIESEDENVLFYMPSDIAFDSQGNIYVLDSGNHRIQKFSPEGRFLSSMGSKGQGPAEFQYPLSLDIDPEGHLYISDQGNQRIQILKPDGTNHKTIKIINEPLGTIRILDNKKLIMGGGGGLILLRPGAFDEEQALTKLLKVLDLEGRIQKGMVDPFNYKNFLLNRMGNRLHFTVDKNKNVYVAFDYQNRIEKYSAEGKLLWRADRALNYSTEPKSKGRMERSGGRVSIEQPEMNQCSGGIAVDDEQRVWVITLKRQMREDEKVQTAVRASMSSTGERSLAVSVGGHTDVRRTDMYQLQVFSPEGILLGTFPLNHFVDDIRIAKNKVYLLDRMRGMQFYEYKIVEK